MTDLLFGYPNQLRLIKSKREELLRVINYMKGLTTPENDSIMVELENQWDAIVNNQGDLMQSASSEFKQLLRSNSHEQRTFDPETGDLEEIALIYTDAVAIIRTEGRRVFWLDENGLCYQEFTSEIELWLESGKLMSDYNDVPF